MDKINLYTDGGCSGNPGPGGYCAILEFNGHEKIVKGSALQTTNNKMELTAVLEGLKALKRPCEVIVISDSKYVCDAINKNWLPSWKKNGWKKSDKSPVLNVELWQELAALIEIHSVSFSWIKGHAGHPQNERCDEIAVNEYKKLL